MRILWGACPDCGGDIYIDYKHGKLWKCIECSKVFSPKSKEVLAYLRLKNKEAGNKMGKIILERAEKVAEEVAKRLGPYCHKIEVAGSVRRKKPWVNDIDFVLVPSDLWNLHGEIMGLGQVKLKGNKIMRVMAGSVQIDLYFAAPETWATLLLIRTGSAENNIRLATMAKKKGWHLAASGDGLFNELEQRIAGDTELSIYEALGLPWQRPEERG